MAITTYFAVLPFKKNEDGDLCPAEAIECPSARSAEMQARAALTKHAGAVAFSRTGDPQAGEWSDASIIARLGETPADLEAVSGAG